MSRGFRAIWQGHFAEALNYNQQSVVLFGFMLIGCVYGACATIRLPKLFRRLTDAV